MTRTELKQLIKESIEEIVNEIGAMSADPADPQDSFDDHAQDLLDDIKDSLQIHLRAVEDDMDDDGKHYDELVRLDNKINDMMDKDSEMASMINNDHELEGMLGRLHNLLGGGGSGEKFYVAETWEEAISSGKLEEDVLSEKAPPGMEPWVKANKERFVKQYGKKKGLGVVYATAWKMFYKKKNK
jgi:hypothetical protein